MKRNFFSLFVAVNFLVVGHLQSAAMQTPAPTPTPKPGLKIKSMVVTTPTPAPPPKRIKGTVAGPASTPIRIDKGTKTGPGPTPIKIGKDRVKAEPTKAPIKVIKTQVSTPTPAPNRKIKDQVTSTTTPIRIPRDGVTGGGGRPGPINLSGPTPTPNRKIKDQVTSTTTPIRIPKDGVTGGGGRPGPINLGGPPPGSKKLIPGSNNLPPLMVDDIYDVPSSKKLIPGPNNLPPGPAGKSIILQSLSSKNPGVDNSVPPEPPPPNTGTGNQNPNPVVNGETPLGTNTGTAAGPRGYTNKLTSKLAVYTKDGKATTSTNLGGEFPSKLETTATVNKVFTAQWSRDKAGTEDKANLFITPQNSEVWLGAQSVTMPAQSTSIDVPVTMPNVAANTYRMVVAADSGNSNNVRLFYAGEGAGGTVSLPPGQAAPPNPSSKGSDITTPGFKRLIPETKGIGENNLPPSPAKNQISTGPVAEPAPPPSHTLPDLICANADQKPVNDGKNNGKGFRYEIKNIGTAESTGPWMEFQILDSSGKVVKKQNQFSQWPFKPDEAKYADFYVPQEYHNHAVRLVVDPENKIKESNEQNNRSLAIWYGGFPTASGFGD